MKRNGARAATPAARRPGRVTGLLGGSFNPAHRGHRRISLAAIDRLGLAEVWWLVSPGNPLKSGGDMASLIARFASARAASRRAPIRATAIESELGTRYTVDTLRALVRRYPRRRFVWIMGADNLAQFHRWKDWRAIARLVPIAVFARPGYEAAAFASPAMAWLGRYRTTPATFRKASVRAPMLVWLRYDPDPISATALRAADPAWAERHMHAKGRDEVTGRPVG
ncbi:nicotinate-nucleotide adenylyltransferase [Tsuneonella sp. SYSU-LHT278]|uniref:nicotinate-nucleotide adenylyltransferase n=1 Tax=Tsuneonella sediminis TaxID=3416089 RepID=UPI003F7B05AE